MSQIAPTGNTPEEDFKCWHTGVSEGLQKSERNIILIKDKENIIGFFQYYTFVNSNTNKDTFMMEEIQFSPNITAKVFSEICTAS